MSLVLSLDGGLTDKSVNRTAFSLVGAAVPGDRGYKFDGASGYIRSATEIWRSADSLGTIIAWVKLNAIGADQGILCSGDEATGDHYFGAMVTSTNKAKIITTISGGGSAVAGNTTWTANVWKRLAFVSSGTAWSIFINGVEDTPYTITTSNTGNWFADVLNRDSVTIGALKINVLAWYANAEIDDVQVYNTALLSTELLDDYELTRGRY